MIGMLGFGSCHTISTTPSPPETRSTPARNAAELEFNGRIEANAIASVTAAQSLPDSDAKKAVLGPLGVIEALTLGYATPKQKEDALAPVLLQLAGKYQEAAMNWAKAASEADGLRVKVQQLEQQVRDERIAAAAEITRQLQAVKEQARRDAESAERKLIAYIFFGGGFLLIVAGVVITLYAAQIPQFGPRAGLAVGGAGGASIATGIVILQLLSHPEVIWWGLGISSVLLAIGVETMYRNHKHHVESTANSAVSTAT